jgi:hypothetical protein
VPTDTPIFAALGGEALQLRTPRHAVPSVATDMLSVVQPLRRTLATAPVDVLTAGGVVNPGGVVALAGQVGIELAAAVTLLFMESGGGRNVWGHDRVITEGIYVTGSPVARDAYLRYKARRAVIGSQGVGPTQLTWHGFQDQADAMGAPNLGCWTWEINCRVGFGVLGGLLHGHGDAAGFAAYNGSGAQAQAYGARAVKLLQDWRARLGAPSGAESLPHLVRGDHGPGVASLQRFLNRYDWRPVLPVLPADGNYGPQTTGVVAAAQLQCGIKGGDGASIGPQTRAEFWQRGWRG